MALLLTNHDLSGGKGESSEIAAPATVSVAAITSGCPAGQRCWVEFWAKGANGAYAPVTSNGLPVKFRTFGNGTFRGQLSAILASNVKIVVRPERSAVGLVSLDVETE